MVCILILAAGNSSRLGSPKQLLAYKNKTLIRALVEKSLAVSNSKTIVVTGAEKNTLEKELSEFSIDFVHNAAWQSGMASTIKTGVNYIIDNFPNAEGCIISVSDQPYIETEIFQKLIEKSNEHTKIVASQYHNILGTPVFFPKKNFNNLLALTGKEGAKKMLDDFKNELEIVHFKNGEIDIDTRQNYRDLLGL